MLRNRPDYIVTGSFGNVKRFIQAGFTSWRKALYEKCLQNLHLRVTREEVVSPSSDDECLCADNKGGGRRSARVIKPPRN
jgi:hypothetical protein